MKKIAIVSKKGGVGKTTTAILLCAKFNEIGHSSAVRDYDPQGSASKSFKQEIRSNLEFLLLDTPPSLSLPATASSLIEADLVLVPTTPNLLDLWECRETVDFVRSKSEAPCGIIINKLKQYTVLSKMVHENLGSLSKIVIDETLADRQCYAHAAQLGLEVLDRQAATELNNLAKAVLSIF